jgi:hypothetical protein
MCEKDQEIRRLTLALAERDALLRDTKAMLASELSYELFAKMVSHIKRIDAALSTSAEPSAPVETAVFNDPLYNAESDARNASSLLEEVLEWFDDGVGRSHAEFKLMRKIGAWLGRSAPSVDGDSDECAHSYANGVGCPECGKEFGAEPNAPECKYCGDTGKIMVGRSGDANDGNAPILEACEDCDRGAPVERDEWVCAHCGSDAQVPKGDHPAWQARAALERKP